MTDANVSGDLYAPRVSRRALRHAMPPEVRRIMPAGNWAVERLWALPNPTRELALAELDRLLGLPLWRWQGRRFQVSPRAVLADPARFAAHMEKAIATDLTYPIVVYRHRGQLVVLDGYHRVLKALVLGRSTIPAVEVSREDLYER